MTTKQLGNIGEAKALAKFVELQIPVYIPFGDNERPSSRGLNAWIVEQK